MKANRRISRISSDRNFRRSSLEGILLRGTVPNSTVEGGGSGIRAGNRVRRACTTPRTIVGLEVQRKTTYAAVTPPGTGPRCTVPLTGGVRAHRVVVGLVFSPVFFKMPSSSQFAPLADSYTPQPDEICSAVTTALTSNPSLSSTIVFAGVGDPLLRLPVLKSTCAQLLLTHPTLKFRVTTSGLHPTSVLPELKSAGITSLSIPLNYQTSDLYVKHMSPPSSLPSPFEAVCEFISSSAKHNIAVTVTAVDNGRCDIQKVKELATQLGSAGFKVRSYHP